MLIAQITDLHVTRRGRLCNNRVDTGNCLRAAVECIRGHAPALDLVIVSGDLVDLGEHEEYRQVRELVEPLPTPVFVIQAITTTGLNWYAPSAITAICGEPAGS